MSKTTRIASLFLSCSALFLVGLGVLVSEKVIILEMHTDYSRLNPGNLYIGLGIALGSIGLIYWMIYRLRKRIANQLTKAHLVLTYSSLGGLWLTAAYFIEGRRIYEQPLLLNASEGHQNWWLALVVMLAIAQFAFMANLLIALASKKRETTF